MPTLQQWRLLFGGGPITLVRDSFNRPDSATTLGNADSGQVWTALSGTWGISSGQAYVVTTADGDYQAAVDVGRLNVQYACDVTLSPTLNRANPAFLLRGIDASNYLIASIYKTGTGSADVIQIYKRVSGTYTLLAVLNSAGSVEGTTYHFVISVVGNTITVYRNGGVVISYTLIGSDAVLFGGLTATKVGFRLSLGSLSDDGRSRWDNLLVKAA